MTIKIIDKTNDPVRSIILAARNCYYDGDVVDAPYEKVLGSTDETDLLTKLMMRGHWSVFEQNNIILHARMSRAAMAQLTRHRHMSFAVQSLRYCNIDDADVDEDCYYPPTASGGAVIKAKTRKGVKEVDTTYTKEIMRDSYERQLNVYNILLHSGMPEEDARMVLPIGIKVNVVMGMNIRTMLHFIQMRGAGDAQDEIRDLAHEMDGILKQWAPLVHQIYHEKRGAIERQKLAP